MLVLKEKVKLLKIGVSIITLFVGACATQTDDQKIGDAQACLDRATPSTAASCMSMVDGLTSEKAYLIRCAGVFIQEGFDQPEKFVSAFKNLKNSGGTGANASVAMMSQLAFSTDDNATLAVDYCNKSTSKGLIMMASLANIATTFKTIGEQANLPGFTPGSTTPPSPAQMQTAVDYLTSPAGNQPATQAAVGATAKQMQSSYCSANDTSNADICANFNQAVSSGASDQQIGAALITLLNQNKTP